MENPYQEGNQLRLAVCERGCTSSIPQQQHELTVNITRVMPEPTMSVVMKVEFRTGGRLGGTKKTAVLKMYDRRFSPSLRRYYNPTYDEDAERAWGEYVQGGGAPALFSFMREKMHQELQGELVETDSDTDPSSADEDDDNDVQSADGATAAGGEEERKAKKKRKKTARTPAQAFAKKGKREGIIQWKALDLWHCETHAYKKLTHLQGYCIPQFFAVVCLTLSSTTSNLSDNEYFTIGGIMVEYVPGFNLTDLGVQATVPQEKWHSIIQHAVEATEDINDSGVINLDCQPRNVMVDRRTLKPKHIDLAQCLFAEEVGWRSFGTHQYSEDNPHAIGSVMVAKLKEMTGFSGPEIHYRERYWGWAGSALVRLRFLPWTVARMLRRGLIYGYGAGLGMLILVMWRFVPFSSLRNRLSPM